MEYEWAEPRTFPASPFMTATAGLNDDTSERARKRTYPLPSHPPCWRYFATKAARALTSSPPIKGTHYEAMDVDTPPRPSHPLADLPPAATAAPPNAFHFDEPPPPAVPVPRLDFDAAKFEPTEAFGVEVEEPDKDSDKSLTFVGGFRGDHAAGAEPRRRRNGGSAGRRKASSAHDDDDEEEERDEQRGGMMGMLPGGRRIPSSDFSFQVHHHHASGSQGGAEGDFAQPSTKWLHGQTPYTLLGLVFLPSAQATPLPAAKWALRSYLQFASLSLLAVIFLTLSLLFLYTLYTDVVDRLNSLTFEIRSEILQCAKAYVDNKCQPGTRLPFMEGKCSGWEECMGREAVVVGKTRVVAETLAEVVNGFVDIISFKTMVRALSFPVSFLP